MQTPPNRWDLIIVGAGPVGLAAAIVAGRNGCKTLLLEQADRPGPAPRGETVHDHPIFTELLGDGVLSSLALNITDLRLYHSPGSLQTHELHRKSPSIVFEWHALIEKLNNQATSAGVTLRCHAKVTAPLIENGICVGVKVGAEEIRGKTVIGSDGHQSVLGRAVGVPYPRMDCLIVKRLVHQWTDAYRGFSYFFIPVGSVAEAPRFPPGVIFAFPRQPGYCEVGFMVFTHAALKIPKYCDLPDKTEMMRVWNILVASHPKFSDLMRGTVTDFEYVTAIPTAALYPKIMPIPGLMLLGDSAGFVEASGGSGISAGMQAAKVAVEFLKSIPLAEDLPWTADRIRLLDKTFSSSHIYKHIRLVYRFTQWFQRLFYARFRTAEKINQKWPWFRKIMKLT
jgi:flavin-dependent dehydrogenase